MIEGIYIEGIDFEYVERESADLYSIRWLDGRWKDVIFTYGVVSLIDGDPPTLRFQFKIEEGGGGLYECVDFKNALGDLLSQLLERSGGKIGKMPEPSNVS